MSDSNVFMIIVLCLGGVFFLIGAGMLVFALISRRKAEQAQAWSAAQGRVLSSQVRERESHDSDDNVSWSYEPVVEYEYLVMGAPMRGNRVAFGAKSSGSRAQADQIAARYLPGGTCTVYYNPQNPKEAVLERQAQGSKAFIIIGAIFMVVSLLSCCGAAIPLLMSL